jgi:hypothetical protein
LTEAGWLNGNWFGANQWFRYYLPGGRWWAGMRLGVARDRDPYAFAGFAAGRIGDHDTIEGLFDYTDRSPWRVMGWLQGGYSWPEMDLDFRLDAGRFADSDNGVEVSVMRRWDAASVGVWLRRTNHRLAQSDLISNGGVRVDLPVEKWFGGMFGDRVRGTRALDFSLLSSWREDAARTAGIVWDPEDLLEQMRPIKLKKNVRYLLDEYCSFEKPGSKENEIYGLTDFMHYDFMHYNK